MIDLVLPLLLPTPTIWFSLDHEQNVSDGVVSGIGTLFSLDHKLYASDYDSDSIASENKPRACWSEMIITNAALRASLANISYLTLARGNYI